MTTCTRCGRKLTNPGIGGMGPVCARAVLGAKPKRIHLFDRRRTAGKDERQPDLFGEVQA